MGVLAAAEIVLKATGFKKTDKAIDDSRKKFKKSSDATEKDLKAVGGAFKTFAAAAVVSIGAVSVAVVKMGADFEKQMAIVGGVSRASEEDLIRLEKAARESGATTEKTAKQSAEAMQFLAMAGLEANEIIAALPGVINLSTAANIDLAASADIATNVLAGMGLQVSDLARVNDTLVAASTRANTNVLELGEAFKYVAPVAKAVNLSLEDTSAILGTLANSGVKASDAGTDLRQALVRTGKVAKQLGMDEGSTLIDVLKRIKEEQWGVTEVTKAFGLIATKSVLILKDNIDEYEKLAVSIKGASGEAEELADKIRDTLSGQFATMVSALQEAGLQIFDIFKNDLKDIVTFLTEAVRGTYDLIEAFKGLYELRSVSETFAQGMELISSGLVDMSVEEFTKKSYKERQALVDRYEEDLLKLKKDKEQEYTDYKKQQAEERIKEYQSYLGKWGGLFDERYKEIIKNEELFLKKFIENADQGFGKAFSDKAMIGQKTATSVSSTPEIKQFVEVDLKLPKDAMEKFDDAVFDSIGTLKSYDKELIKLQRSSAKLARGRQTTGDEFSNELDRLIKKVITDPKKDESTTDFVSAVNDFGAGITSYLAGVQAMLDLPTQIVDAITGIVDTIADFPTTLSNSVSSLGESVGGFVSGGFGWRGKEEEKERRRAEQARLAELRTGLEAEWDGVIAVFDLSPLEESLYNLNKKYAEQVKLATESGASIEKLNEARALEIASITQAALEASQAQFSGLYTGIEGLRRTAALDKSANPFSFLLDEFVDFEEQISQLNDSTEEQIKLQEKQVSTLSDMYNLAQTEAANLKVSNDAVQSMIDQLTLQSVGTSFEDIETRYNELFNQALTSLDTADIQSFLTFTNDYMETLESAGMDAETVRISTKADLEYLQGAIDSQLSVVEENTNAILALTNAVEAVAVSSQYEDALSIWEIGLADVVASIGSVISAEVLTQQESAIDVLLNDPTLSFDEESELIKNLRAELASMIAQNEAIAAAPVIYEAATPRPTSQALSTGDGQTVTINLSMDGSQVAESVVLQISNSGELTQVLQNSVN